MNVYNISKRNLVLMYDDAFEGIYFNIHLIFAKHRVYVIDSGMGKQHYDDVMHQIMMRNNTLPIVLINSHEHWDHVWANGYYDTSMIVAHKKCREALEVEWDTWVEEYGHLSKGAISKAYPNITFDSTLVFEDDDIFLGYAPGHTLSDIYVFDALEKVLNVGDNVGDTDDEPIPELVLDHKAYAHALHIYEALNPQFIVSGHNSVKGKEFLDVILSKLEV